MTLTAGGNDLLTGDSPGAILRRLHHIAQRISPLGRVIINTVYDPSDGDNDVGRRQLGLSRLAAIQLRRRLNALNRGIRSLAGEYGLLLAHLEQLFHERELLEKAHHQRRADDQPGVRDQTVMVEGRVVAVDSARYWPHRTSSRTGLSCDFEHHNHPSSGGLLVDAPHRSPRQIDGLRLSTSTEFAFSQPHPVGQILSTFIP